MEGLAIRLAEVFQAVAPSVSFKVGEPADKFALDEYQWHRGPIVFFLNFGAYGRIADIDLLERDLLLAQKAFSRDAKAACRGGVDFDFHRIRILPAMIVFVDSVVERCLPTDLYR